MRKVWEVFRFELDYQLRRASTRVYFLFFFILALGVAKIFAGDAAEDGYFFNAPGIVAVIVAISSIMSLLVTAAVAGDAATRDAHLRMDPLLFTSPVGKTAYLGGRFLGAFAVSALLLLVVPLGLVLAAKLPGLDRAIIGPFQFGTYAGAYALFGLPNAFVATAILFAVAALSRRAMSAYLAAGVIFFLMMFSSDFIARHLGRWELAKALDLSGFTALLALWQSWTQLQKDTLFVAPSGAVLQNRLLWLGISSVVLVLACVRFRFAHHTQRTWWRRRTLTDKPDAPAMPWSTPAATPRVHRTFGIAARARQVLAIALRSFREIMTSRGVLVLPVLLLMFIALGPELLEVELGLGSVPTTARIIRMFGEPTMMMIIAALITLYAGMLVWGERDVRLHEIGDAAPVPDWVSFAGKYVGLALMLAALQATFLLAALFIQVSNGYTKFEFPLYLTALGLILADLLLFAMFAMTVHVLVNHKYVAHTVAMLAYILKDNAQELGIEHNLWLYGSDPGWQYSDMMGFGPFLGPWMWFKLFWAGWALLFAVLSIVFWARGQERGFRQRIADARRRFTRLPAIAGAAALLIITLVGGFVFYNTNVLNRYRSSFEEEALLARYERRYGKYEQLPQPALTGTKLYIEIHPERRKVDIRGTYQLANRGKVAIDTIHMLTHPEVETRATSFDEEPARLAEADRESGHQIYRLARPLRPGETVRMNFEVHFAPRGFPNRGGNTAVTRNATYLEHMPYDSPSERRWLPLIGYQPQHQLGNDGTRRRHGLRSREDIPSVHDVAARYETARREMIDFEAVIGTDAKQTAIAPGTLRRTWLANGRRYFHYVPNAPIRNGYAIFSAPYAVREARWKDVAIQVVHDPRHPWNVERMITSVKASLESFTRELGPYPYAEVRLVEYPSAGGGMGLRAHPDTIMYSEGFAVVKPDPDPRALDLPFAVVSHEMAHQWWGNQLVPAYVEGAPLITESLSWYSAMMVVQETDGREKLERLLRMMRREYLTPRAVPEAPLLRATDQLGAYRSGPFAMYALRDFVGERDMNAALRRLLSKHGAGKAPLPTSLDLYAELQKVTPAASRTLLADLFERITFWELRTKAAKMEPAPGGAYRVTLDVEAYKVNVDGAGHEKRVPLDDMIAVGVFDAEEKQLYLQKHRIRSGEQSITVTVPRLPARAGVDPYLRLLDRNLDDNAKDVAE